MLMTLDTTGGGRARFNPNLYADGKAWPSLFATLSLLGSMEKCGCITILVTTAYGQACSWVFPVVTGLAA